MSIIAGVQTVARSAVKGVVEWAFFGQAQMLDEQLKEASLRRAVYENDLPKVFKNWDSTKEKLLTPDTTIQTIIGKFATNIFQNGTYFYTGNQKTTELLNKIIQETKLDQKLSCIVEEACINPFCGIRSVWDEESNQWIIEIKTYEDLEVVLNERQREKVEEIYVCHPIRKTPEGVVIWFREKWTDKEYWLWPETPEPTPGKRPVFKDSDAGIIKQENTFGKIPITLVRYRYDINHYGKPVIGQTEILIYKNLVRLGNKRVYAHLEHGDPTIYVIDGDENSALIRRGVGGTIVIQSSSEQKAAQVGLLQMEGLPESFNKNLLDLSSDLYQLHGLTPPGLEEMKQQSDTPSGRALKVRDRSEEATIKELRERSFCAILYHLEWLLKAGASLRKDPAYKSVNEADETTWKVEAKYPEFFPLTPDEKMAEMQVISESHLSAKAKAEREAQILQVDDDAEVAEIQKNIEAEQDRLNTAFGAIDGQPLNDNPRPPQ